MGYSVPSGIRCEMTAPKAYCEASQAKCTDSVDCNVPIPGLYLLVCLPACLGKIQFGKFLSASYRVVNNSSALGIGCWSICLTLTGFTVILNITAHPYCTVWFRNGDNGIQLFITLSIAPIWLF